jgi:hypothetical protein
MNVLMACQNRIFSKIRINASYDLHNEMRLWWGASIVKLKKRKDVAPCSFLAKTARLRGHMRGY